MKRNGYQMFRLHHHACYFDVEDSLGIFFTRYRISPIILAVFAARRTNSFLDGNCHRFRVRQSIWSKYKLMDGLSNGPIANPPRCPEPQTWVRKLSLSNCSQVDGDRRKYQSRTLDKAFSLVPKSQMSESRSNAIGLITIVVMTLLVR